MHCMEDVCGKLLKNKLVKIIDHYMILEWQINNKRDGMHFFGTCQIDKEKASFSYVYSACLFNKNGHVYKNNEN